MSGPRKCVFGSPSDPDVVQRLGDLSINSGVSPTANLEVEEETDEEPDNKRKYGALKSIGNKLKAWGSKNNLRAISTKSIGRSALSQRVHSRTFRRYATPELFSVTSIPHSLVMSLPSYGVTNRTRTESVAEFKLYRNQLLSSRGASNCISASGAMPLTPSMSFDSPKSRGIAETSRLSLHSSIMPKQLFMMDEDDVKFGGHNVSMDDA